MANPRIALRWTALAGLWILAGVICWVLLLQAMMALFSPLGTWHAPGIAKVAITQIERDQNGKLTGYVLASQGERKRTLRLAKEECAALEADSEVWILDNYFVDGPRPDQFLLTPWRLLMEYPEPLLALILWVIWRIRKSQDKEAEEDPDMKRTVWRDDFYERAQRFSPPKDTGRKE